MLETERSFGLVRATHARSARLSFPVEDSDAATGAACILAATRKALAADDTAVCLYDAAVAGVGVATLYRHFPTEMH
ncbi:hypothetical protein [Nocardia abscessus]|uniref:hypothetical protein n=1 Tax=Nocardia abscessus TaxID=120957 RepID=UPI0024578B39|nr:hypothetical protein [Nocardia abscessus]